jgi:uncharacterized membrane protein
MLVPLLTALHVITIILWIGGVAFVTMIIFPMLLKMEDGLEKVMMFQRIENTFARHARYYAWTTALTGSILLYLTGQHTQLFTRSTAGVSVMIVVWTVYILVLTLEKRIFGIIFRDKNLDPSKIFLRLSIFHWVVLSLSLFAVFAGVWTGHGGSF